MTLNGILLMMRKKTENEELKSLKAVDFYSEEGLRIQESLMDIDSIYLEVVSK